MNIENVTSTSAEAYKDFVESGAQDSKQRQILAMLRTMPDSTASEIIEAIKRKENLEVSENANTRARLCELRKMGLAKNVGTKKCSVSGKKCLAWVATDMGHLA